MLTGAAGAQEKHAVPVVAARILDLLPQPWAFPLSANGNAVFLAKTA
jgi:hypothetical protein